MSALYANSKHKFDEVTINQDSWALMQNQYDRVLH